MRSSNADVAQRESKTDKNGNGEIIITDENGNVTGRYKVTVKDNSGLVKNAVFSLGEDGALNVTMPDGKEIGTSNRVTVTVTDKDNQPVADLAVNVTDTAETPHAYSGKTSSSGSVTLPPKPASTGGGGGGGGGGGSSSGAIKKPTDTGTSKLTVTVTDKDGKNVDITAEEEGNNVTVKMEQGQIMNGSDYYTVAVTDGNTIGVSDVNVSIQDSDATTYTGITDEKGLLVIPAGIHKAYIYGYEDGEFKPEGNMTRAEVAAIFARNIAERKNETISAQKASFYDVDNGLWYNDPIAYLEKYDVISGYTDGSFLPEEPITRAEFVTIATNFYRLFGTTTASTTNKFGDLSKTHWAYNNITTASNMGWITGRTETQFCPDNYIKRAEVVAIVNRILNRDADNEYTAWVKDDLKNRLPYSDKFFINTSNYWAFDDILEASHEHEYITEETSETWLNEGNTEETSDNN